MIFVFDNVCRRSAKLSQFLMNALFSKLMHLAFFPATSRYKIQTLPSNLKSFTLTLNWFFGFISVTNTHLHVGFAVDTNAPNTSSSRNALLIEPVRWTHSLSSFTYCLPQTSHGKSSSVFFYPIPFQFSSLFSFLSLWIKLPPLFV